MREPLVLISFIKKNQNQRISNPGYFKTLKQTFKLLVFMKELAMKWQFHGWLFDFSKEIENCGYMPKLCL